MPTRVASPEDSARSASSALRRQARSLTTSSWALIARSWAAMPSTTRLPLAGGWTDKKPPEKRSARRHDPPDDVADIVGHQHRAMAIHHHAHRAAMRLSLRIEEAGQHVLDRTGRLAVGERHEHDLVAAGWIAIQIGRAH